MKYLALLALSLGCGKVDFRADYNFMTTQKLEYSNINSSSSEFQEIKQICDALQIKEGVKSNYVIGSGFSYENTIKECDMAQATVVNVSKVTVEDAGSQMYLRENSSYFAFKNFELKSSGAMAQICEQVSSGSVVSPYTVNDEEFVFFTTSSIQNTDCLTNSESRCIKITKARKVSETEVQNTSVEWIRFQTRSPSEGVWNYRQFVSPTGCAVGSYYLRRASLK